ncbi:hypothetical protein BC2230_50389 [Burkholderia cepacia]
MRVRAAGGFPAGPDHGIIRACVPAEGVRPGCLYRALVIRPRARHDPCAACAVPGRLYLKYRLV